MAYMNSGVGTLRLSVPKGATLVIRNYSGVETVTGSGATREDASAYLGAGAYSYGPQSAACNVQISTTGDLDYSVVAGDATPGPISDSDVAALAASGVNFSGKLSYNRAPSNKDNASRGYTQSSLWQYGGVLYQPVVAPDTNSATWQALQPTGSLPVDVLGSAAKCAGGVLPLKAGFTGPAISLTATVSAAPVTTDINILAGGTLDADAVRKVFASADAGTYVYVTKVYDQTGTGNHLTFSYTADYQERGFYLIWDVLMGCYVLASDNNDGSNFAQSLTIPGTLSLAPNATSAFFFGRGVNSANGLNNLIFASFGSGGAGFSIHAQDGAAGPTLAAWMPGAGGQFPPSSSTDWAPINCRPCVCSYIGATGGVTMAVNESSYSKSFAVTSTAYTGGLLGLWNLATGKAAAMRFVGFAFANATATAAQAQTIRNWFYTRFNVRPQARDRVVYVGDSRGMQVNSNGSPTIGQANANVGLRLAEMLKADCEVINCSTSGITNARILTEMVPGLVKMYRPGVKNIAVILAGVNDFVVSTLTPAQSIADLAANVSALRAAGYYVMVINELATTWTNGAANTNLAVLRGVINAGQSGADRVIDVSAYTAVNTASNTTYYPDGLHPSMPIHSVLASVVAEAVDAVMVG